MSDSHTPEPWGIEERRSIMNGESRFFVLDAEGCTVCRCRLLDRARRIVACVNACAGIPTEFLELRPDGICEWCARKTR